MQGTTRETAAQVEGEVAALREAEVDVGMTEETMMMVMTRLPRVATVAGTVQLLVHHGGHHLSPVMLTVSHARYCFRRLPTLVILDIDPPRPKPRSSLRDTAPRAGHPNRSSSSQTPNCDCGIPASEKRVTQKSAREGKEFYACAQGACGFFKWIESEHDREGRPTPLVPAKRAIGASHSVSGIHLSIGIPKRESDVIRKKPWHQRVNVSARRTPFSVPLQRRASIKGVFFGGVQKARKKDVVSLSGMMSPPSHLDRDPQYQCRRGRLATMTHPPVESASRQVIIRTRIR